MPIRFEDASHPQHGNYDERAGGDAERDESYVPSAG
jgi:hypothetical protein